MTTPEVTTLYDRDRIIAGVEKLRFYPLAVTGGEGSWLMEAGGRRLLDLSATWTASGLGHGRAEIAEALARIGASPAGASILSATHPDAVELAERLLELTTGSGDRRVYLGHAGSDANDVAIRCALHATGRTRVLAFGNSYHGGVGVAMRASGVHVAGGSAIVDESIVFTPYPDPYRGASEHDARLAALANLLRSRQFACLMVEPIQSDGGLIVPQAGFLSDASRLCKETGTLLICDEVKVGLGRTGAMHAFEHEQIEPDIVTFGKSLGGGLPISAAIGPAEVMDEPTASALMTTVGNPYSTAAALAVLEVIESEELAHRARDAGDRLMSALAAATADLDHVGDVRGRGLVIGIDLVADRASKRPDQSRAAKTVYRLWELGAVAYYVGDSVIEVTPPLTITDGEIDQAAGLLARAVAEADTISDQTIEEYAGW